MMNKFNYVFSGEDGSSNVEIIIWISVVLVLATVLFLFRDAISGVIDKATKKVNNFRVE